MQFGARFGIFGLPQTYLGEVFPLKYVFNLNSTLLRFSINIFFFFSRSRTFLSGLAAASHYLVASFSAKTYFNVETWLSLPGAILFYGFIGLIGYFDFFSISSFSGMEFEENSLKIPYFDLFLRLITFYFILPETEQRTLEDIELHYSDNSKGMTDIHIPNNRNQVKSNGHINYGQSESC